MPAPLLPRYAPSDRMRVRTAANRVRIGRRGDALRSSTWQSLGVRIYAGSSTFLKKSTEVSGGLSADQKVHIGLGAPCIVVNTTLFDGYLLCIHHTHGAGTSKQA